VIKNFDFDVITGSIPFLWKGLQVSFYLTFLALVGGIVFGTLLAIQFRMVSVAPVMQLVLPPINYMFIFYYP